MLLPVVVAALVERLVYLVANDEFKTVPILQHLSKLHGFVIACALIYSNFNGRYFDLERLFMTDSPWSISFSDFMRERSNVFSYALEPVIAQISRPDAHPEMVAVAIAAVLLPAICAAFAFRLWPRRTAWRAMAACAIR
ncbi:MAG: hypothetical protein AB7G39_09115, partial [Alphaproteobacteria bacterium]